MHSCFPLSCGTADSPDVTCTCRCPLELIVIRDHRVATHYQAPVQSVHLSQYKLYDVGIGSLPITFSLTSHGWKTSEICLTSMQLREGCTPFWIDVWSRMSGSVVREIARRTKRGTKACPFCLLKIPHRGTLVDFCEVCFLQRLHKACKAYFRNEAIMSAFENCQKGRKVSWWPQMGVFHAPLFCTARTAN